MGVFNPGLLIDFDCDNFGDPDITVVSGTGFQDLAEITLTVNSPTNAVWLNAYATWTGTSAADFITFRFFRDGTVALCSAIDSVDQANQPDTTAFSCCDTDSRCWNTHLHFASKCNSSKWRTTTIPLRLLWDLSKEQLLTLN